jgi:hypothetical protein
MVVPSGKLTVRYRKSPSLIGKSTISKWAIIQVRKLLVNPLSTITNQY